MGAVDEQNRDQWLDRLQGIVAQMLTRQIPLGRLISTGAIDDLIRPGHQVSRFTLWGLVDQFGDPELPLKQQSDRFRDRFAEIAGYGDE